MLEPKILADREFFVRNVQPLLEGMGWTVRYAVTDSPRGHIVIQDISDVEHVIAPELRKKFTRILDALAAPFNDAEGKLLWHYATDEDKLQGHFTGDGSIASTLRQGSAGTRPEEPGDRPLPTPRRPVFDYTALKKDPENERRLREYSENTIMVKSRNMAQVVKPAFVAGGWIYGGTHYGNGMVGLQIVLDADDAVVDPAEVLKTLRILQVPHTIHRRSPEATDEAGEDDWEEELEPEPRFTCLEDVPGIYKAANDIMNGTSRASEEEGMETQEQELEPEPRFTSLEDAPGSQPDRTGALRLEEGQEMHIKGAYGAFDEVEIRLEVGDNIIAIVSNFQQAQAFLMEATELALDVMTEKGRRLAAGMAATVAGCPSARKIKVEHDDVRREATGEETELDGGKEREKDEFAEQGQSGK